ncbi:MAG: hypothetical protein KDA81_11765 [Planctomycetaceae bacterium]|nr:hypothetical protein [Planctomycetaceae bacterium]
MFTLAMTFAQAQQNTRSLKLVDHVWGFHGRVVPGQFNPLSVLLDNQTDEAIDGEIVLEHLQGLGSVSGGSYVQPVFISPTGRRWVQFYPYIGSAWQSQWRLRIGEHTIAEVSQSRSIFQTDSEATGGFEPAVVILDEDGDYTPEPRTVKHMTENLFPPYATVTFGLHTVFLDHVPDWEAPRQQAFLSWLRHGGNLILLQNRRGEFPQFSGELGDLNQPLNRFAIGSGIVSRRPIQRNELTSGLVSQLVQLKMRDEDDDAFEKMLKEKAEASGSYLGQFVDTEPSTQDESLFREMRELTMPEHAWWLIFLLGLLYIGLIYPGCFLISKRNDLHFLTTYGAIAGLSVVFSLIFLMIGRRGYGENTTLQCLAIARAEDATHWNVLQWSSLFVVTGDQYQVGSPDQQSVHSTGEGMDHVDVQITAGNSGQLQMQIPPYSAHTFMSRRRVPAADWKVRLQEFSNQESGLVQLRLQVGAGFPASDEAEYTLLVGRRLYTLRFDSEQQTLSLFGAKRHLAEYCHPFSDFDYTSPWTQKKKAETRTETEIFFDESQPQLFRRSLLDDLVIHPVDFDLPGDRIRLFVYTPVPEGFDIGTSVDPDIRRSGRILFVKDIFVDGDQSRR